ncbi:10523_t:CDS:2 [Entrophospora sp. SA101]|nr:10523_t:CDS:2 [Entrophospora sp. SA101]
MPPKKEKKTNAQNKQLISSNTRSKANSWSGGSSDRANSQAPTSFSFWSGFKEEFISNIEDNLEFTRPSFVEAQVVSRETDIHRELDNNVWHIMNKITTEMNLGKFGTSSELLSQRSDSEKIFLRL